MEDMTCALCGQPTHDDFSDVFEDVYSDGESRRICFVCAPPDYPQERES